MLFASPECVSEALLMKSNRIVTADDLGALAPGSEVHLPAGARLTALADDLVRARGLRVVFADVPAGTDALVVAVASDHGGFRMKEDVKALLGELGRLVLDLGTSSEDPVDYPDFAHAAASAVSSGRADLGIVVDGAGMGSAMTANKVPGVRAAACYSAAQARNSREHNDANVLTLGSRMITTELMREIVTVWLASSISEERHRQRVDKIVAVERKYQR
jgi:ribose 5-phosphate isomerase B